MRGLGTSHCDHEQEVAVAAALSGDPALLDAYRGGDVYYTLARNSGLTDDPDPKHWKDNNQPMRQWRAIAGSDRPTWSRSSIGEDGNGSRSGSPDRSSALWTLFGALRGSISARSC